MNASVASKDWFGHPRGLSTLFFTEVWERFSYYGMRPLLILYITAQVAEGGLGKSIAAGTAIVGLYTFGVYSLALPGGWIADRLFGKKKAVLYGGIVIAAGHFTLAVPAEWAFYTGLVLVVIGTGLLKPNVSAIVGDLYKGDSGARRDAGFSIFYTGINIGAFAGPLVCGFLFEVNPHVGFGAAGVGMVFGLIQYVLGQKHLEKAGNLPEEAKEPAVLAQAQKSLWIGLAAVAFIILALVGLNKAGMPITLLGFAQSTGIIVTILAAVYFASVIIFACRDNIERRRVGLCAVLFFGAAMFWSGFEQASTSLNLFARDQTNRFLGGWETPVAFLQSVNPLFIILLAPVVGSLWVYLNNRNPSIPVKFGLGLALMGVGFLVLAWGSQYTQGGGQVSMMWLVTTYFFHTIGELCLSPVGLSSVTKLAPERMVSQMMGTWFMGAALGNLIAGLVAGYIESMPQDQLFGTVAGIVIGTGLLFLILSKPINWLAAGVK